MGWAGYGRAGWGRVGWGGAGQELRPRDPHSQLVQAADLPSSLTETRPLTLTAPRLTYRKTSQKRSGEVRLSLATILGWVGMKCQVTLPDHHQPEVRAFKGPAHPSLPVTPGSTSMLSLGGGAQRPPGQVPFARSPSS